VERADRRVRVAAAGLRRAVEEDRVDVAVLLAAALERAVPVLLHAVHVGDDAAVLALVRVGAGAALGRDLRRRVAAADLLLVQRAELATETAAAREQREQ